MDTHSRNIKKKSLQIVLNQVDLSNFKYTNHFSSQIFVKKHNIETTIFNLCINKHYYKLSNLTTSDLIK